MRKNFKDIVKEKKEVKWRLPEKHEIDLIYFNLAYNGIGNFKKDTYYWCFADTDVNIFYMQNFENGNRFVNLYPNYIYPYRAIRDFETSDLIKVGTETETGYVFAVRGYTVYEVEKIDRKPITEKDLKNSLKDFIFITI